MSDLNVTTSDGKYTVIQDRDGLLFALRHGQSWHGRDMTGDNLVLTLAQDLRAARERIKELEAQIADDKEMAKEERRGRDN